MLDLLLTSDGGLTLTEISGQLGVPKSTAHAVLKTMQGHGYVSWDATRKVYSVGLHLVALASAVPLLHTVQAHARAALERLATELQETAVLHAFESDGVVAIDKVESQRSVRYTVSLGHRWPMHASSAGKLYLAQLDEAGVREFTARRRLERLTDRTIVDVDRLIVELRDVRRNGYASQFEELLEEVAGYAAPIYAHTGHLVAALTVTGPAARVEAQTEKIVPLLTAEALDLSRRLALSPNEPLGARADTSRGARRGGRRQSEGTRR